jgi:hypothetical protein
MKKGMLAIAAIITFTISAYCSNEEHIKGNGKVITEKRSLSSFEKISTAGSIEIELIQGNNESAEVTADENILPYIITEVKDNSLQIHVKDKVNVSATKLKIVVNFKNISDLSAAGSGDIQSKGIKADDLDISQGGSGSITLNVTANKLNISKAGSGNFKLEGKAGKLNISSAGSGDVHAENLVAAEPEISMVGSGDIYISKAAKAKVSSIGSGEVHYE